MITVYRIAKAEARANDLSGFGAFSFGGRWNNPGTYMLYTSENSSLAYLENLVHFDELLMPPRLFISTIEVDIKSKQLYVLPDEDYPEKWLQLDNLANKFMGDQWMHEKKHLAVKVRSAVNTAEYNYLLNPLFPKYTELVKVKHIAPLNIDARLVK
ncbi:RES domain-containing protein [Mucilaginibacter limnophilus]|uniref:RES domain-containing protein n=1 Tax=Mucilaginibacter limnophilus TaxID=1932778 RepID=A0A437MWK4_9SPHI|nr:RES family NAD+ phosphorylase [Mucilaginibacter limnophilus]RVU02054.1 RES domain-containing protein [Mucilaginibacter limnophilus]